jgi:hypothetical protein
LILPSKYVCCPPITGITTQARAVRVAFADNGVAQQQVKGADRGLRIDLRANGERLIVGELRVGHVKGQHPVALGQLGAGIEGVARVMDQLAEASVVIERESLDLLGALGGRRPETERELKVPIVVGLAALLGLS